MKVYTRNGLDWTKRFSIIAGTLDIPGEAIIDGEAVVVHEGRTNFSELQAELAQTGPAVLLRLRPALAQRGPTQVATNRALSSSTGKAISPNERTLCIDQSAMRAG
jgi:hypothetical protein